MLDGSASWRHEVSWCTARNEAAKLPPDTAEMSSSPFKEPVSVQGFRAGCGKDCGAAAAAGKRQPDQLRSGRRVSACTVTCRMLAWVPVIMDLIRHERDAGAEHTGGRHGEQPQCDLSNECGHGPCSSRRSKPSTSRHLPQMCPASAAGRRGSRRKLRNVAGTASDFFCPHSRV